MQPFSPAIGIMNRLRYPAKFGLVTLLMLIPILSLSDLFISTYEEKITFIKNERMGLEYIASVRKLVENVPKHRGMSNAYLSGDESIKAKILAQRDVIDNIFVELQQVDTQHQQALSTSGKVAGLVTEWNEIKSKGLSLDKGQSFRLHTQLITDILSLITYVADTSGLILDPELDSYYLMDLLVLRLPSVVEAMGQARGLAAGIAAAGTFTPESWTELALRIDRFQTAQSSMQSSIDAGYRASDELVARLQSVGQDASKSVANFASILKDRVLDSATIEVSSSQVFEAGSKAIDNVFRFYDTTLPFLDSIFERRINHYRQTEIIATTIIIVVLATIIYLFIGFYLAVKQSIQQLSLSSEKIAAGDLTTRVSLTTRDELNQIADIINGMVDNFAKLVSTVMGSASQVASAAEQLSAVTTQTERAVDNQRHEIDQVATAINEMSATVQEVARSANSASEAANHANNEADQGRTVVNQTIQSIHQLSTDIASSSETISQLASNSQSIGNVLNVIKEIAEQTNLLALNAAIEAARAGEQGRGFAVVADEVRTLAQRTQDSTKEIEDMISLLQGSAHQAVTTMEQSRNRTNETVEKANLAGGSLESIVEAIRSINDMNSHIATASEEQTAVTEEININITNVNNVSQQTVDGAKQTQSSSQDLARLSQELQNIVNQFKV